MSDALDNVERLPTVARLYYTGVGARRYKRASVQNGPGEALTFVSLAEERIRQAVALEREKWTAEITRLRALSAQAAVQPLTDAQMLACVRSIGTPAPMSLTRDRGPYEVTEPTWFLTQLVRAIERAHGITATAPRG